MTRSPDRYVLGINAFHADASAVLLDGGEVVCAIAEERVNRAKHFAGLPVEAVRTCLRVAGIEPDAVGHVAVARDGRAARWRKLAFLASRPHRAFALAAPRLANRAAVGRRPRATLERARPHRDHSVARAPRRAPRRPRGERLLPLGLRPGGDPHGRRLRRLLEHAPRPRPGHVDPRRPTHPLPAQPWRPLHDGQPVHRLRPVRGRGEGDGARALRAALVRARPRRDSLDPRRRHVPPQPPVVPPSPRRLHVRRLGGRQADRGAALLRRHGAPVRTAASSRGPGDRPGARPRPQPAGRVRAGDPRAREGGRRPRGVSRPLPRWRRNDEQRRQRPHRDRWRGRPRVRPGGGDRRRDRARRRALGLRDRPRPGATVGHARGAPRPLVDGGRMPACARGGGLAAHVDPSRRRRPDLGGRRRPRGGPHRRAGSRAARSGGRGPSAAGASSPTPARPT